MGSIYFTSDIHFGHKNIINYCRRPFLTVEEMDQQLKNNWNKTVKPTDTVYCLGDFLLTKDKEQNKPENISLLLKSLNGKKHLVVGNHDNNNVIKCSEWISVSYLNEITINGQFIVMCHYKMATWNQSHRKSWHLYGHSHGTFKEEETELSCDVGTDCWNYCPVSFDIIKYKMEKRINKPQKTVELEIQRQYEQDKNLKQNQELNNVIIQEFISK
jgi:calcineurin-like phosphoesterase family protein